MDGFLDAGQMKALLDEVLKLEKRARGWCPNCNKHVIVTVPDPKAVVGALGELLNQSKGRPREQVVDQSVVVNRKVVLVADLDRVDVPG